MLRLASALILLLACAGASLAQADTLLYALKPGQTVRPVTSAYMLEYGSAHMADTYLTPLHYRGQHFGMLYERTQAMKFSPEQWIMQLSVGGNLNLTKNPARNATMASLMLDAGWGMMRRWRLPYGVWAGIGPSTSISVGALYLARNGNNPASAKASWTVGATGYASWSHKLWRVPFTLRYQASVPVTGVFFSPDYAQLYYQIYLGDRGNLAHAAWWGNYFLLDQMLSADLHFGATTVRIGYRGKYFSSKVNHLVSHDITHSLVLGITCEWLSLRPGSRIPSAKIISAYE